MTTPMWIKRATRSRRSAAVLLCVAVAAVGSATYGVVLAASNQSSNSAAHPPTIVLTFPASKSSYGAPAWHAGCSNPGYCGSASDASNVSQVQLSVQQVSTSKYWSGAGFSSSSQVFVTATLQTPGATSTNWSYGFPITNFPSDGKYLVDVRATDGQNRQTPPGQYVEATFTIDKTPPPPPTLTQTPPNQTTATTATFAFNDGEAGATFKCSLDSATASACTSPITYSNLSVNSHTFAVVACDASGNCGTATTFTWTVTVNNFGISGNSVGTFYPGAPALPINLIITNPFNFVLKVTSVTVTVTGTNHAGCGPGDFNVVQNLVGSVNIPANSTESLSQAGDPQSNWPMVQMIDTNTNQNACQGATVTFSYSGNGTQGP